MEMNRLADQLVKTCRRRGADAAEVYIQAERNLDLEVRNGEVETVEEAAPRGVGIRLFSRGRMAFVACNDLQEPALNRAVARAIDFARRTTPDTGNGLPEDRTLQEVPGLYDPDLAGLSIEKKIALARETEALAIKDLHISKSGGARYRESESLVVVANSLGMNKSYRSTSCSLGVSVVAEKGNQKSNGDESCARRRFSDLKSPALVAEAAARSAREMLDARPVRTQRAPVIFHPDVAAALLGGVLAAVSGERVQQKASFLAGRVGQVIAAPLLTLIDDGTLPGGLASAPFDGEGVGTRRRIILEQGQLRGYLYNTEAARRAGVQSTGNASRPGYDSLPGIGPHNFYLAAGSLSPQEIIAATPGGLLLKEVTGYGLNPVNGQFSGGAAGFWIEKGQVVFPVQRITIAGSAAEMLMGIDMVGNDLDLSRPLTAPTFRIRELQIGGE